MAPHRIAEAVVQQNVRSSKHCHDLQAKFEFHHGDYEKQCLHALGRKDKAGMVMNNPSQSVFLFMDRQHLQVSQSPEIMFMI